MLKNYKIFIKESCENYLMNNFSFIVHRGKKKNVKKHNNYKVIKITDLKENTEEKYNLNKKTKTCIVQIELSNKDKIKAIHEIIETSEKKLIDNNIKIYINDDLYYDISHEYNDTDFYEKIIASYKKYINKTWKIK
jgi:hypothetical protein